MELKELKEKALMLKAENDSLKTEIETKKDKYARVIKKNFEDIVFPYVREMNAFVRDSLRKSNGIDKTEYLIKNEAFDFRLELAPCASGIRLWLKEWKSYGLDCYLDYGAESYGKLLKDNWVALADLFATVDSCNAFIGRLNVLYADILTRAIEKFEEDNPSLAEALKDLTEKLGKASCMEEKGDGTVEIHLGGKTYTAVLKEE